MITFTAVSSVLASKYYNHEKKAKKRQRKIEKKKNSTKNFNEMNQTERNGTERKQQSFTEHKGKLWKEDAQRAKEIHVCSSLDLMTVIILAKEHKRTLTHITFVQLNLCV